ncbi:MAG: hypothetical protein ACXWC7_19270, partial [Chitinophagaceae bacterium]
VVQSSVTDIPFEEYVVDSEQRAPLRITGEHKPGTPYKLGNPPVSDRTEKPELLSDREKLDILDNLKSSNLKSTAKSFESDDIDMDTGGLDIVDIDAELEELDTDEGVSDYQTDDDIFERDMQSILKGEKVFNDKTKAVEIKSASKQPPVSAPAKAANLDELSNQHAIFDQIAQSMQYAKAYDLGSIDLEKRFSEFNTIADLQQKVAEHPKSSQKSTIESRPAYSDQLSQEQFLKDLDMIARREQERSGTLSAQQQYIPVEARTEKGDRYVYESPSTVMASSMTEFSYAQNPAVIGGIAVADAIQIGLGAAAMVQAHASDSQGSFTLTYDKVQRLLTNEARTKMPGAQKTKQVYKRQLFWIGELKEGFADANVVIEWEGNPYGEIATPVIRRDIKNSTAWTKSSANLNIEKIDRIPLPGTDPRTWPIIYTYNGTFDPYGNGHYEFSGEFEVNAFGGLKFVRHEVEDRTAIKWAKIGEKDDYVVKGKDHTVPVPTIPKEQMDYLKANPSVVDDMR